VNYADIGIALTQPATKRGSIENHSPKIAAKYAAGESSKIYSQEELVAEMTAAFLEAQAGIIEDDFQTRLRICTAGSGRGNLVRTWTVQ
jgi:hypothetical protein